MAVKAKAENNEELAKNIELFDETDYREKVAEAYEKYGLFDDNREIAASCSKRGRTLYPELMCVKRS